MIAVKKILCPVDSSEFSARALRYAAKLASWYDAELTALSVRPGLMPPSLRFDAAEALLLEDLKSDQNQEEALRAFVSDAAGPFPARVVTSDGPIVQEILRIAVELPADLIVMGTHGLSGLERLLLGSVTEKVLRKAPCPVLTVPRLTAGGAAHAVTCKTIVCAVDFSDASRRALDYAFSLAQEAGGRLLLLHALEGPQPAVNAQFDVQTVRRGLAQDAQKHLEALVPAHARVWCEAEAIVGYGKAYREVLRVAAERHADLIVLGVQGRGAIDLTLFGSTTHHVIRAASCPVLTVGGTTAMKPGHDYYPSELPSAQGFPWLPI
jgi:nucleotide-binding universal stress UspA family protein